MTDLMPKPGIKIKQTITIPVTSLDVGDTYIHGRKRGKVVSIDRPYFARHDRTHVIVSVRFPGNDKTLSQFRHEVIGTVDVEVEV